MKQLFERVKSWWNRPNLTKPKRIAGIILMVVGVVVILSAIIVPIYTRQHNKKLIADIRAGKYAHTEEPASQTTQQAVDVTQDALEASDAGVQADDQTQQNTDQNQVSKEQQRNAILQTQDCMGIVEVDKINVQYAIVEGAETANLKGAVGHMPETVGIGEQGNCVIAGHNGGYYGEFFKNLDQLELNDIIKLTDLNGHEYEYVVYDIQTIDKADWSLTKDLADKHTVTLLTCADGGKTRIAVSGILYYDY